MVQRRVTLTHKVTALIRQGQDWYRRRLRRSARPGSPTGPISEQAALSGLSNPRPKRRWEAAAVLGKSALRGSEAIAALSHALADPEPFVRWQAAEALAAQEPGHVFPVLRSLLFDPDPLLRSGAAVALGRMGGEAASVELHKALGDPEPRVRSAVARALGECGDPSIAQDLLPLLYAPDESVVRAAAEALAHIGSPSLAGTLADVLGRPGQSLLVRRSLAAALARMPHPEVQETLLAALADPDPQVRGYAASALGQVGDETAGRALGEAQHDTSSLINGTVGDVAGKALTLLERRGRQAPPAAPPITTFNGFEAEADGDGYEPEADEAWPPSPAPRKPD